jgi:hypothetical protein
MTNFGPPLVARAIQMFECRSISGDEAQRLVRLVGSREEFLAHLVIKRKAFASHPGLLEAIANVAKSTGAEPTTRRGEPMAMDASRSWAVHEHLDLALGSLIKQMSESHEAFTAADAAVSLLTRIRSSAPPVLEGLPLAEGDRGN